MIHVAGTIGLYFGPSTHKVHKFECNPRSSNSYSVHLEGFVEKSTWHLVDFDNKAVLLNGLRLGFEAKVNTI